MESIQETITCDCNKGDLFCLMVVNEMQFYADKATALSAEDMQSLERNEKNRYNLF